mgnify:CR=1 FL=1
MVLQFFCANIRQSFEKQIVFKNIEKKVKANIAEVAEFATNEPLPSEDELYTDIYK